MNKSEQIHSHLFTIRIWTEEVNGEPAWRGQVDHVLTGDRQYFRDWEALVAFLQAAVSIQGSSVREEAEE